MNLRLVLTLCCAILAPPSFFAQQSYPVPEQPGSPVYNYLRYIHVLAGEAPLVHHAPASRAELLSSLRAIDTGTLDNSVLPLVRRIESYFAERVPLIASNGARLDIRPSVALSFRYSTDGDALLEKDLADIYRQQPPVFSFPLDLRFGSFASVYADFPVQKGYWAGTSANSWTNLPLSADECDMNAPDTAGISLGNTWASFMIGRGRLTTGESVSGSMFLSDASDRLDFALLTLFSPRFRVSLTTVELAPSRFVYYHHLAIKPFRFLSVALAEASNVNSSLDLRYLNPATVFHSFAGWRDDYPLSSESDSVGSQFGLIVDVVPRSGWRAYGQFVMNQFQTPYERSRFEGAQVIPDSLGGLAGIEHIRTFRSGILSCVLEGLYSTPWLYIMSNPEISFFSSRRELVAPDGKTTEYIRTWLGNGYGPDTASIMMRVLYDVPFAFSLSGSYRFTVQGSNGIRYLSGDVTYPTTVDEAVISTPSADSIRQHRILIEGTRAFSDRLEASASVGYSIVTGTVSDSDFSLSASVRRHLR